MPGYRPDHHYGLRYELTWTVLEIDRPCTVGEIADRVLARGFELGHNPNRRVSETLRSEISKGRVRKLGRNRYVVGRIPPSTRSRIGSTVVRNRDAARDAAQGALPDPERRRNDTELSRPADVQRYGRPMTPDEALAPLPASYHELYRRAVSVLRADDRVRGVWLSGSLARGVADAASDLDLLVAVADEHHEAFCAEWRGWLGEITSTVVAETLPFAPGSFYSVTTNFERFDVVAEPVSAIPNTFFPTRLVVFDHDDLTARVPPPEDGPGPNADAVAGLITEFFRVCTPETVIERDDWLLAREHLHLLSSLVYKLFVEANAPLPPMGVKQWSTKLTPDQRSVLANLPVDARTVSDLAANHLAYASVFVTNAEVLADRLGIPWPKDLEAAANAHLGRHLGLEEAFPRNRAVVV